MHVYAGLHMILPNRKYSEIIICLLRSKLTNNRPKKWHTKGISWLFFTYQVQKAMAAVVETLFAPAIHGKRTEYWNHS